MPEARVLRALFTRAGTYWMSSLSGMGTEKPAPYINESRSFQRILQDAQRQGISLREFEKRLAR